MEKEEKVWWSHRWMAAESVFSTFKRIFGEYVSVATGFENIVRERMAKVSLHNLFEEYEVTSIARLSDKELGYKENKEKN